MPRSAHQKRTIDQRLKDHTIGTTVWHRRGLARAHTFELIETICPTIWPSVLGPCPIARANVSSDSQDKHQQKQCDGDQS